jgi:hypothetical protein
MQLTPDGPLLALSPDDMAEIDAFDRTGGRPRPRIRMVVARNQRVLPSGTLRALGLAIDGPPVGWTAARGTGHHPAQRCGRSLAWEVMADWIFQGNPRRYDLGASATASREQWWRTPRYRDRMAIGDRVWLQVVEPKDPGGITAYRSGRPGLPPGRNNKMPAAAAARVASDAE